MKQNGENIKSKAETQAPASNDGIRRLFRHSAIYSLSTSVQRLQGLILTPVYTSTKFIPQVSQYGNYGLIYTFIAFMNFVYLYGMDSAFLRYFFLGKSDRKTVFSTTFLVLINTALVTSALIFLFARQIATVVLFNPELTLLVRLASGILFFDTIGNLPFLILRAEERAVTYTVFRMLRFSMELALNILFVVVLRKGVPGIMMANLVASVLNLLIMFPFTWRYLRLHINWPLLREMVAFGLPFLPNGIAFMMIEMQDRFLVTRFLGKEVMAFYHANYKFASVLLLLIIGFRNAWQPFFLKIARQPEARKTYSRILNDYLFVAASLTLFILFFVRDLLTLHWFGAFYLLGIHYWSGIPIIPWIVLSYLFFGIYVIFTPAFYITKKSRYMIIFTGLGAVVNLVTNLLLLPRLGMWGAVSATVLAYATMAGTIVVVSQRIYPIPVDWRKLTGTLMLVGLAFVVYYIYRPAFSMRLILFAGMVISLFYILLTHPDVPWRLGLRNNISKRSDGQ